MGAVGVNGPHEMPGPFDKQQSGPVLINKNASRIGDFYGQSLIASEEYVSGQTHG